MDQNPGYYHQLLKGESSSSLEEAIRTGGRPMLCAEPVPGSLGLERVGQGPSLTEQRSALAQVCLTKDVPRDAKFWGEIETRVLAPQENSRHLCD